MAPEQVQGGLLPHLSDSDIDDAERQLGQSLPTDVRSVYRRFNGMGWAGGFSLFPGPYRWMPLCGTGNDSALSLWEGQRAIEQRLMLQPGYAEEVEAVVQAASDEGWAVVPRLVDPTRLPVGMARDGELLMVDLSPPTAGTVGQLVAVDGSGDPIAHLAANGFLCFVEQLVQGYEQGAIAFDHALGDWVASSTHRRFALKDLGSIVT